MSALALPPSATSRPQAGRRWHWLLWLVCSVAVSLLSLTSDRWQLWNDQLQDGLSTYASHDPSRDNQILLVDISDKAIQDLGGWPFDRGVLADLVEELLGRLNAKTVALDMVFPEHRSKAGDDRLAALVTHAPLVLSVVGDLHAKPGANLRIGELPQTRSAITAAHDKIRSATGFIANHSGFAQAKCVGHVSIDPDLDGVVRRLEPRVLIEGRSFLSLSLAMIQCQDPTRVQAMPLPSSWRLPYRKSLQAFETVDALDVLQGRIPKDLVTGRYVLVGSSALGLGDIVHTPLTPATPGVLVHAQALSELLRTKPTLKAPGHHRTGELALLWLTGLIGVFAWSRHRPMGLVLITGLMAVLPISGALWLYPEAINIGLWTALAGLGLLVSGLLLGQGLENWRIKNQALRTLSQYLSEPIVRLLQRSGLGQTLTPKHAQISVLVVDMANYTQHAARLSLDEAASLTRGFLESMTEPVMQHQGTLNGYTGDGLIAFFGAPLALDHHARKAIECAKDLQAALQRYNESRQSQGLPSVQMRIGIESGEALVGDLGTRQRSVYTAVGNCINLASRAQELAKSLGLSLVIGPQAATLATSDGLTLQSVGTHVVRGLDTRLEFYTR